MGKNKKQDSGAISSSTALGSAETHAKGKKDFDTFLEQANARLNQAALQPGNQSAELCIFDSEAMYAEVFELKKASYAVMEQEQAAHAAALFALNQASPSKADLGKYLQHLRQMMQQQHEYIAQVAVHMQLGQRIEFDALTKHITKAFKVCNKVLAGALKSLQASSRGVKRDGRIMMQTLDDDKRLLQHELGMHQTTKGIARQANRA